jgi:hypothetical protein
VARAPVQAAVDARASAAAVAAGCAYLATLLALDHFASYPQQLALGVVTCVVLVAGLTRVSPERRAQALGVVVFATIGEATGSLLWGVYRYRLHNLPLFVPPAHGIVYLSGLALAASMQRRTRALVTVAAVAATCRCSCSSSGVLATERSTPASSWSSRRWSCMAPRSEPGIGPGICRVSESRTATRRAASRRATCGST